MSKSLVILSDVLNENSVYGTYLLNTEVWEQYKKLYALMDEVEIFTSKEIKTFSPKQFLECCLEQVVTDSQQQILNNLNLLEYGVNLPKCVLEFEGKIYDFHYPSFNVDVLQYFDEDSEEWIDAPQNLLDKLLGVSI